MSLLKHSSWSIPVYKLMHWRTNNWEKIHPDDVKEFLMRINCDQLMIYDNDKKIYNFNINERVKAIIRKNVFVLFNGNHTHKVRKIRFMLKASPCEMNDCVRRLSALFPVVKLGTAKRPQHSGHGRYHTLQQIDPSFLQNGQKYECELQPLPAYIEFVKSCLMDSSFPQAVMETEKILKSFSQNT